MFFEVFMKTCHFQVARIKLQVEGYGLETPWDFRIFLLGSPVANGSMMCRLCGDPVLGDIVSP